MRRVLLGLLAFVVCTVTQVEAQGKQGGVVVPLCVEGCGGGGPGVSVTPDGGTLAVPANSGLNAVTFLVTNGSTGAATYSFACTAVGVTCGTVDYASYSFDPNETIDVEVTFTAGSQSGTVTLTASGPATDTGTYNITLTAPAAPTVTLRNQNGDNIDRSLCLTSSAGESAAMQCGDLLVAHSTPAYATMGRERSLALVYTSAQAVPQPVVVATVTQPIGAAAPTTVLAELKVKLGGSYVTKASASYVGWGATTTPNRQIALAYVDQVSASGIYEFQLTVTNQYPGSYATTVSGTLILVNRLSYPFGRGWSLAGVEELKFNQPVGTSTGDILWVGGDGSAKRYTKLNATTWVAPPGSFRDTLVYSTTAQTYTRTLRHGVQVVFNSSGRHLRTVNRTQQSTAFTWNGSGQLTSIRVPPNITGGVTYTLTYLANGYLDKITDPAGRVTKATFSGGSLTAIVDPDTTIATQFVYDGTGRLVVRLNRRGYSATYAYDHGLRLTRAVVPGTILSGDTTVFRPWDEQGLALAVTGQIAVDTSLAFTEILGPRVGVADNAKFWVDRWGAPTRITNALNQTTTLTRGDATNPSLVTKVVQPDGRISLMTYNSRGNLTMTRDSTSHLPNGLATAVSSWAYNSPNTKDAPSSTTDPENILTQYQYNSWGLTSLVIAPNLHRTAFEYKPAGSADSLYGLLRAVVDSNVAAYDSASGTEQNRHPRVAFSTNALGNVTTDTSALGRVRTMVRDGRQLVTDVYDGAGYRTEFTYNQANLVVQSRVHVEQAGVPSSLFPADSGATAALVTTRYYSFGLLDSIADPRGVKQRFMYDGAGRLETEKDAFLASHITWYNAAGLVDSVQQRTGGTGGKVRHTYDAGGRLLKSQWDARQVAADSVIYTYDSGNRMLTATLGSGRTTTRTYYGNGALKSETQAGPHMFRHTYSYDRAGKRLTYVIGKPGDMTSNDSVSYRYDPATGLLRRIYVRWRRPTGLNDPIQADSVRFAWDALGRRDTVAFTNGAIIRFAYDLDGALRVLCSEHSGTINDDSLKFSLHNKWIDRGGRIRKVTRTGHTLCPTAGVGAQESSYRYDVRGQLLVDSTQGAGNWIFRYDASGNMVRRQRLDLPDLNVFTIGAGSNRITRHDRNGNFWSAIAYDPDGARTSECSKLSSDGTVCVVQAGYRQYNYDGLARTVATWEWSCTSYDPGDPLFWACGARGSSGTQVDCAYEPLGRLGRSCEGFDLGYDSQNVSRTVNDSTTFGWTFVQGPGTDDPVLGYSTAAGGVHAYFITDGGGRLIAVTDRNGTSLRGGGSEPSVQQQAYRNWGGAYSGGTASSTNFNAERFESGAQSGLSFFRNRVYDQATGRWTQEDPIGIAGGLNLYQFNGNSPAMYTDPFGLKSDTLVVESGAAAKAVKKCRKKSTICDAAFEEMEASTVVYHVEGLGKDEDFLDSNCLVGCTSPAIVKNRVTIQIKPSQFGASQDRLGVKVDGAIVVGHEAAGHAIFVTPDGTTCLDITGCAKQVENRIRKEFGEKYGQRP